MLFFAWVSVRFGRSRAGLAGARSTFAENEGLLGRPSSSLSEAGLLQVLRTASPALRKNSGRQFPRMLEAGTFHW